MIFFLSHLLPAYHVNIKFVKVLKVLGIDTVSSPVFLQYLFLQDMDVTEASLLPELQTVMIIAFLFVITYYPVLCYASGGISLSSFTCHARFLLTFVWKTGERKKTCNLLSS